MFSNVRRKNWQNALECAILQLKFHKFPGALPPDSHAGEGLWHLSPDPTPSALQHFALRSGPLAPQSSIYVPE